MTEETKDAGSAKKGKKKPKDEPLGDDEEIPAAKPAPVDEDDDVEMMPTRRRVNKKRRVRRESSVDEDEGELDVPMNE